MNRVSLYISVAMLLGSSGICAPSDSTEEASPDSCESVEFALVEIDDSLSGQFGERYDELTLVSNPTKAGDYYPASAFDTNGVCELVTYIPMTDSLTAGFYDITGSLVCEAIWVDVETGFHYFIIRAVDIKDGIYFFRLETSEDWITGKLIFDI